jgi:hypothetical protein
MDQMNQFIFMPEGELEILRAEVDHLRFLNTEERETICELSQLLLRAAEVLEGIVEIGDWNDPAVLALVKELRKAAE